MQLLPIARGSSSTTRWLAWLVGYAVLSWIGWAGAFRNLDRFDDPGSEWLMLLGGATLPLILAFLAGAWLRAYWWISTAPFVVLLSMLATSIYLIRTRPGDLQHPEITMLSVFCITVIYPVVTWRAALTGVYLGWLLADENRAAFSGPFALAFTGFRRIVQEVMTVGALVYVLLLVAFAVTDALFGL